MLFHLIVGANSGGLIKINRPEDKQSVMSADKFQVAPRIGAMGNLFVLATDEGPKLPAVQSIAVPQMAKRIDIVVSNDIALSGLDIDGHENEMDFVAKEPILQCPINWKQRRVVHFLNGSSLLEVQWKQCEAMDVRFALSLAARKVEHLKQVKTILRTESVVA